MNTGHFTFFTATKTELIVLVEAKT